MTSATHHEPPTLLVGYDGSEDADAALAFAIAEARARGGRIRLVYSVDDTVLNSAWGIVLDVDSVRRAGQELLEGARRRALDAGLDADAVEMRALVGHPAAVLSQQAQGCTLAIVGRHSESGSAVFVGSTAVGLVTTSPCPVVVATSASTAQPVRTIGVGIDPAGRHTLALEWALRRARRVGASVKVLSVVKRPNALFSVASAMTPAQRDATVVAARERVHAAVDLLSQRIPGVETSVDVCLGGPVDELLALSNEVDMLIVGAQSAFPSFSVGGVTRGLMAHAGSTLGIVRHA